jgi:hypothetical protein
MKKITQNQRLSTSAKKAGDFSWYKEQADLLDTQQNGGTGYGDIVDYKRQKVNYDLFNNILNLADFEYVCQPYGADVGELPATMVNRDIVSGKIKAMLGMEMKRSFSWKVIATNPEATTRREDEEFKRIREFVISSIMQPIRQEVEVKAQQQMKSAGELSQQQVEKIQQQVEAETKQMTPDSVRKYMERDHQDPAEVLSHQLLEYLIQKCDLKRKFNDAFKHGLLSAKGIMYVGTMNGEPEAWNVNSIRFNCEKSTDTPFTQDGEWATCEYRMTPSEVIARFNDELNQTEIDKVYSDFANYTQSRLRDSIFSFNDSDDEEDYATVRVLHCTWKSLRKIGFLTFVNEQGEEQEVIVDESYEMDVDSGDISVDWKWIPEVYETWKIGSDIYKHMRPIPGQFKDIENLYYCKLPYYGVIYDNMNSQETALMDRLKVYQYYYNIVMYRLELLLASDKGKKVMMNINAIPDSAGIDIEKWKYYMDASPVMWYDPNEEGVEYNDVNTMAKTIDLSLASDIGKYIELAEYLKQQAGLSVGITPGVEGQTGAYEGKGNAQQNLIQSSHILEPYFDLHNHLKKSVLQALLETAKIAYANSGKKKLTYILDDFSRKIIDLDIALLDNSTLGLFVSNAAKAEEAQELVRTLAHAALQAQKVEFSDVLAVVKQTGIVEAEETLKAAEQVRRDHEQKAQQEQLQANAEEADKAREFIKETWEHEANMIRLKEEERRETEIVKGGLMAASFNPDMDKDQDGVNDFIEIARDGLDADIKQSAQQLAREKFEHDKIVHQDKMDNEDKKMKANAAKATQK